MGSGNLGAKVFDRVLIRRVGCLVITVLVAFTALAYATAGCLRAHDTTTTGGRAVPTVVRLCVHGTPILPTATPTIGNDPTLLMIVCATPTP